MSQALPEEIFKARELLNAFEKSTADLKLRRTEFFANAIDILNSFLKAQPDSPHRELILNIKLSYTRSLLRQLPEFGNIDIQNWAKVIALFKKVSDEFKNLVQTNLELQDMVLTFLFLYPEVFSD